MRLPAAVIGGAIRHDWFLPIKSCLKNFNSVLDGLVVEPVLVGAKMAKLARAQNDRQGCRTQALRRLQHLGVTTELDDEVGLGLFSELGVADAVAEVAELRGHGDAF